MTRTMYDSTTPAAIPADAQMVAGYVDGAYAWTDADWARFPNAVKVRIAVNPATNDGHVLDVEPGNWDAVQSVDWVIMRRAGIFPTGLAEPTVYCGILTGYSMADVLAAHQARGVPPPQIWLANWDGLAQLPTGVIAKQYQHGPIEAPGTDVSIVADYWPGVDPAPPDIETRIEALEDGLARLNYALVQRLTLMHTATDPANVPG